MPTSSSPSSRLFSFSLRFRLRISRASSNSSRPLSSKQQMRVQFPLPAPSSPDAPASAARHEELLSSSRSEPILRRGSPSATRRARVQLPLGSPLDHDGLVTLDSLIRSPHCVRFAGDPRPSRRWQSRDCACVTSRRRQVQSLRAALHLRMAQSGESAPFGSERLEVRILLRRPIVIDMPTWPNWQRP